LALAEARRSERERCRGSPDKVAGAANLQRSRGRGTKIL